MRRALATLAVTAFVSIVAATLARADVIDGDWCLEGKHFSIKGPTIVTPGGATLQGDYTRHSFHYLVPPPEAQAGTPIFMQLMNETTVRVHEGDDLSAPWQIWRRCDVTS